MSDSDAALVARTLAGDLEAYAALMIRLFFATKVWVLKERVALA